VVLKKRREPGSFRQYSREVRKGGRIPEILIAWKRNEEELKKQGLNEKEIANIAVDWKRDKYLLQTLKTQHGSFTSTAEVDIL